jgi:hypothetical protein
MKKVLFYFVGAFAALTLSSSITSCGSDAEAGNTDSVASEPPMSDSMRAAIAYNDSMRTSLFSRTELADRAQLVIDSLYLDTLKDGPEANILTGDDVRFLSSSMVKCRNTEMHEWDIKDFLFFDSLKLNNGLEAYAETLDLGMTAHCDGMVVEHFKMNDSTEFLVWLIDSHTYEACPYGWGSTCFVSLFVNGDFRNSAVVATINGGADPPVWGSTTILAELKNGVFYQTETGASCDGESDADGNEIVSYENFKHEIGIVDGFLSETATDRKQ